MRRYLLLLFWLTGILFPMVLFTRCSATYKCWFQTVFTPEWTHVVMRAPLYGVLAVLLAAPCHPPVAAPGGIQLVYTASLPGRDEVFDIGVDMLGGLTGVLITQRRVVRA